MPRLACRIRDTDMFVFLPPHPAYLLGVLRYFLWASLGRSPGVPG